MKRLILALLLALAACDKPPPTPPQIRPVLSTVVAESATDPFGLRAWCWRGWRRLCLPSSAA
jgi:hypothetical protein